VLFLWLDLRTNNSGFTEAVVQVATVIAAAAIKAVCPIMLAVKNV
jgi:hypothetical protein